MRDGHHLLFVFLIIIVIVNSDCDALAVFS